MSDKAETNLVRLLESVKLNRAVADEGPDNLWAMTLNSGSDQRVYLMNADHSSDFGRGDFQTAFALKSNVSHPPRAFDGTTGGAAHWVCSANTVRTTLSATPSGSGEARSDNRL